MRSISSFPVFVLLSLGASLAVASPKSHTILIRNMQFEPATLEVNVGDTVVWKNDDLVPHSVTSKAEFDSGLLEPNKTFKFLARKKNQFHYVCLYHPTMKASLVVK